MKHVDAVTVRSPTFGLALDLPVRAQDASEIGRSSRPGRRSLPPASADCSL